MFRHILISLLALATGAACAAEDPSHTLLKAATVSCQFGAGSAAKWSGGDLKVESAQAQGSLRFTGISIRDHIAQSDGPEGPAEVMVQATGAGLTFLRQTGTGNLELTTVFYRQPEGKKDYYAVTSRHISVAGGVFPSQFHGLCRVGE